MVKPVLILGHNKNFQNFVLDSHYISLATCCCLHMPRLDCRLVVGFLLHKVI